MGSSGPRFLDDCSLVSPHSPMACQFSFFCFARSPPVRFVSAEINGDKWDRHGALSMLIHPTWDMGIECASQHTPTFAREGSQFIGRRYRSGKW